MRSQIAVLIGNGYTRRAAWIDGLGALAVSAFTLLFVLIRLGADGASAAVWGLFAGNLFGWLLSLLISLNLRRTLFEPASSRAVVLSHHTFALLAATAPFLLINLAGTLFQSLDLYMVKQFHWQAAIPDALALYAAPFRILNVLLLVPTTWGTVALGRYVRTTDPTARQRMFRQDLGLLTAIGFVLSILCTVGADPLTRLGLGERYAASAHILALVGWMTLPVCASAPVIALLTARQHQLRIAACVIGAGGLSLILNVGWATLSADSSTVDGLLGVAAIKVAVMTALFICYWLSCHLAATRKATSKT
jgi:O-antigen/teichoic acid export membrane protein